MIKIDRIIRSRRKTISLQISKGAKLTVRAPIGISQKDIESIVEKKRSWIEKKTKDFQEQENNKPMASYEDGSVFYYLGFQIKLVINKEKNPVFRFSDEGFYISEGALENAPFLFRFFYWEQSKRLFTKKAIDLSKKMGVQFNELKISNAKRIWGSCSRKGNLNINWRLLLAPVYVIDYILIHELSHRFEMNHSQRFWNIVARFDPNYMQSEKWLKENSLLLEFEF